MSDKVYCNECIHFKLDWGEAMPITPDEVCNKSPIQYRNTYREIKEERIAPKIINKNNDCKWFERKDGLK